MYFDRFDICEAYLALEWDWHTGGWLHERPSNARRMEATSVQLARVHFEPGQGFVGFKSLSENGRAIYRMLRARYGFDKLADGDDDMHPYCPDCFADVKFSDDVRADRRCFHCNP